MIYRNALCEFNDLFFGKEKSCKQNKRWDNIFCYNKDKVYVYYTGLARQSLNKGLDLLKISQKDNVLVPAYICKDALVPFRLKGIECKYYRIAGDFSAELSDLYSLLDNNTKALLYVNYFGLANSIDKCYEFCRDNNLYLIEDNAHTIFTNFDRVKGDISIFSLRKFYPVPNGALLIVKNKIKYNKARFVQECINKKFKIADYWFIFQIILRKMYSRISNRFTNKILLYFKRRNRPGTLIQRRSQMPLLDDRLSKMSFDIIKSKDVKDIISKRKENYRFLLEKLLKINSEYFDIAFNTVNDNVPPLAFPIIVKKERCRLRDDLFLSGYVSYTWSDMPQDLMINSFFNHTHFLRDAVLLLPIHQGVQRKHIEDMAKVIEQWACKIDRTRVNLYK